MTSREFQTRATLDTSQFDRGIQQMLDQLRELITGLRSVGEGTEASQVSLFGTKQLAEMKRAGDEVERLNAKLITLERIRERLRQAAITKPGIASTKFKYGEAEDVGLAGPRITRSQVMRHDAQARADLEREIVNVQRAELALSREMEKAGASLAKHAADRAIYERQVADIMSGDAVARAQANRLKNLQDQERVLNEQRALAAAAVTEQLGKRVGGSIERERKNLQKELNAAKNEEITLTKRLQSLDKQYSKANDLEKLRITEEIASATERRREASARAAQAEVALNRVRGAPSAQQAAAAMYAGTQPILDQIDSQLAENQQMQIETMLDGVKQMVPEYEKLTQELQTNEKLLEAGLLNEEKAREARERNLQIVKQINDELESAQSEGIVQPMDPEAFRQAQLASLSNMERLFVQGFHDMGRRFTATFQFALSGALIYGVQQFIREFAKAAIDVERSFADISSALEFDFDAERGTEEFNRQVEGFRRQTLQLANEFNVLPEIANKAGYQMTARFMDTADALKAVRAQLLATKISTIDQSEALRALTATAEGFAAAALEGNDSLTFEQRLMERARLAAEGYAAALDEAVYIQQRFGIEVEDTLEGTARAAETFRQLGFTRQETSAIVSAASFQLGQTGANVAERFNRAFGGITQPEVRDRLLELAAASEAFNLTISDFDTGAKAIKAIDDQIRELETVEPGTALAIRDVIGQRRETEVVAAFFGTSDLRRAIMTEINSAAGAAERRFSFLNQTVSEKMASIHTLFQELAQNFERIGGLTPFKALLTGAEGALNILNQMLLALESMFGWLDRIQVMGYNFGDALKAVLSVALALNVTMRAISAASVSLGIFSAAAAKIGAVTAGMEVIQGQIVTPGQGQLFTTGAATGAQKVISALGPLGVHFVAFGNQLRDTNGFFGRLKVGLRALDDGVVIAAKAILDFGAKQIQAFVNGITHLFARDGKLVAAMAPTITSMSRLASGALIAAAALFLINEGIKSGTEKGEAQDTALNTALRQAGLEQRRAEIVTPFVTAIEKDVDKAKRELESVREALDSTDTLSWWEAELKNTFYPFDKAFREQAGLNFFEALNAWSNELLTGGDPLPLEEITGTAENKAKVLLDYEKTYLEVLLDELATQLPDSSPEDAARDALSGTLLPSVGSPFDVTALTTSDAEKIRNQWRQAARLLLEAVTSEDTAAVLTAAEEVQLLLDEYGIGIGTLVNETEVSLNAIKAELERIPNMVRFGQLQAREGPGKFAAQIALLEAHLSDLQKKAGDPAIDELIETTQDLLRDAIEGQLNSIDQMFARRERLAGNIEDPGQRVTAELQILEERYAALSDVIKQSEFGLEIFDEIAQKRREQAQIAADAAVAAAEAELAMARTYADWAAAMQALRQALDFQVIAQIQSDLDAMDPADRKFREGAGKAAARDTQAEAERARRDAELLQEDADRRLDIEVRRAAVAVRKASPIRNRIALIDAEIASLRVLIQSGTLDVIDALEAQIQLQEMLADRIEAQQAEVAAYVRLQAGHANKIKALQAELTILAKNMEFTANAYGKLSEQYSEMALAEERLKHELTQAMLALDDLKRRLGTDITNTFEQAQLDLVAVLAELANAGDLGELEKAELELKRAQAEAAAEKAFFDDRLFQLRFAFETGALSLDGYKAALTRLLESVDTSTQQGKETFLQIQSLIEGLTNDISDMAFNIPAEIRLPTLFEVRRALAADQMGVNYMDNRQVEVNVAVTSVADLEAVLRAVDDAFGESAIYQYSRSAPGGSGIYAGGF